MEAKFLKKLDYGWMGDARLYMLSEQLAGNSFVVVSGVCNESADETYIYGCDESGSNVIWEPLEGSFRGGVDHARALRDAGYKITHQKEQNDTEAN